MKAHSLTYSTCYLSFYTTTHCYNCIKTYWSISTCCSQTYTLESHLVSGEQTIIAISIKTLIIMMYCSSNFRDGGFLLEMSFTCTKYLCETKNSPMFRTSRSVAFYNIYCSAKLLPWLRTMILWNVIQTNCLEFHPVLFPP